MKEIYESPELELLKLLPEQKIALLDDEGGLKEEIIVSKDDIEIPL